MEAAKDSLSGPLKSPEDGGVAQDSGHQFLLSHLQVFTLQDHGQEYSSYRGFIN